MDVITLPDQSNGVPERPEPIPNQPTNEKFSMDRLRQRLDAVGRLRGMWDLAAGGLRGAVTSTLGAPGDLESVARALRAAPSSEKGLLEGFLGGMKEPTALMGSEDWKHRLWDINANPATDMGETIGSLMGLSQMKYLKAAALAAKIQRAKTAAAAAAAAGAGAGAGAKALGYAEGGSVGYHDPLEDALDQAYMNIKFGE